MTKARQKTAAPELRAALAFTGGNNGANQDGPAFARGYSESLREQAGRQAIRGSCAETVRRLPGSKIQQAIFFQS